MGAYKVDCAIIGGGVAGLWTLNALSAAGYCTVLVEKDKLGSGQTIQSQGIIHGGVKYAGSNDVRADFISEVRQMPDRWREHLSGKQKPDLTPCKVLTDHQYLWVSGAHGWFSRIEGLFSTAALQLLLHTRPEETTNPPSCLAGAVKVYTVAEPSVDTASLLTELARPHSTSICYAGSTLVVKPDGRVTFTNHTSPHNSTHENITLDAKLLILTAGNGNVELMKTAGITQEVQVLPLRQVLVKGNGLPALYGHCLDGGRPDISISTHYTTAGEVVWNIGGKVAEEGHLIEPYDLIQKTRLRLQSALPTVSFYNTQWSTFDAKRIEPVGDKGKRLGRASIVVEGNVIAGLPTKLACAPILADMIRMEVLKNISPSFEEPPVLTPAGIIRVATPPWDETDRKWYVHQT